MVFYGYHGVFDEERKLGQRFIVSVSLFTDPESDASIHNLEDTVDYTKVFHEIKVIMETHQFHLLENCANTILDKLFAEFAALTELSVIIQKPSVAIQGSLKSVELEMHRCRREIGSFETGEG